MLSNSQKSSLVLYLFSLWLPQNESKPIIQPQKAFACRQPKMMDGSGASSETLSEKNAFRLTRSFLFHVPQHLLPQSLLSHEEYKYSNICQTNSYFLLLNNKTTSFSAWMMRWSSNTPNFFRSGKTSWLLQESPPTPLSRIRFLADSIQAAKRKGEIPHDRPSKQILWQQHMTQLLLEKFCGEDKHHIMTNFVPPAYLPCTKSLNELEKTKVKELQLETHHRGRFLLAKCLTPPRKLTAILAIIEDEDGECVLLQLYGREHEMTGLRRRYCMKGWSSWLKSRTSK